MLNTGGISKVSFFSSASLLGNFHVYKICPSQCFKLRGLGVLGESRTAAILSVIFENNVEKFQVNRFRFWRLYKDRVLVWLPYFVEFLCIFLPLYIFFTSIPVGIICL